MKSTLLVILPILGFSQNNGNGNIRCGGSNQIACPSTQPICVYNAAHIGVNNATGACCAPVNTACDLPYNPVCCDDIHGEFQTYNTSCDAQHACASYCTPGACTDFYELFPEEHMADMMNKLSQNSGQSKNGTDNNFPDYFCDNIEYRMRCESEDCINSGMFPETLIVGIEEWKNDLAKYDGFFDEVRQEFFDNKMKIIYRKGNCSGVVSFPLKLDYDTTNKCILKWYENLDSVEMTDPDCNNSWVNFAEKIYSVCKYDMKTENNNIRRLSRDQYYPEGNSEPEHNSLMIVIVIVIVIGGLIIFGISLVLLILNLLHQRKNQKHIEHKTEIMDGNVYEI